MITAEILLLYFKGSSDKGIPAFWLLLYVHIGAGRSSFSDVRRGFKMAFKLQVVHRVSVTCLNNLTVTFGFQR